MPKLWSSVASPSSTSASRWTRSNGSRSTASPRSTRPSRQRQPVIGPTPAPATRKPSPQPQNRGCGPLSVCVCWRRASAGRFDRAVSLYIELLEASPALATAHAPRVPGAVGSDMNRRACAALERALAGNPIRAIADPVRTLLLELLIFEEVDPLPPGVIGAATSTAPATTQPPNRARHLGILPGSDDEPDGVAASQPGSSSQPAATEPPRLTAASLVLRAAEGACEAGDFRRAMRLVERGLPYVGAADRAPCACSSAGAGSSSGNRRKPPPTCSASPKPIPTAAGPRWHYTMWRWRTAPGAGRHRPIALRGAAPTCRRA